MTDDGTTMLSRTKTRKNPKPILPESPMPPCKAFLSDNAIPMHPEVLEAIVRANGGDTSPYGADGTTRSAVELFRQHFGRNTQVLLGTTGTAVNTLGLRLLTHATDAIICSSAGHIDGMEGGAIEKGTGCKIVTLPSADGKITPAQIVELVARKTGPHGSKSKVVSLSQPTERGTVYTVPELRQVVDTAHRLDLLVHVDGARLANAAASLNVPYSAITGDVGVDALSFGGTKNGAGMAEAVIIFNPSLASYAQAIQKQDGHLRSKMWVVAAQFRALLSNGLSERNAAHANRMARLLADKLADIPEVEITQAVETNTVFARLPKGIIAAVQARYDFYVWNGEARCVTSYHTAATDIDGLIHCIRTAIRAL